MPSPIHQVPGIQHMRVGAVVVTALSDGSIQIPAAALVGVDEAECAAIYQRAGRRPPFASAINGYLLRWPDRAVLIDTGAGGYMGPLLGRLRGNLDLAGAAAADIDLVLLTHMHIDHIGGLSDADGNAHFPRATVMVHQAELDLWLDQANRGETPAAVQDTFDVASRAMAPYRGRLQPFAGSGPIVPGLEAVALPGHTPGHTGYLLSDGGETLMIWGDICHAPEVQCARPDVTMVFDADPAQAARTRRAVLERAADEHWPVAGMHMSFPGFTRIARDGDGYRLQPLAWDYDLAGPSEVVPAPEQQAAV